MENQQKILLFHIDRKKQSQIEQLCRSMQIQAILVERHQYGESLGALARIQGMPLTHVPFQGAEFPLEMLVFSGMDSQALDLFLKKYKETQLAPIPLKAVLTPYNVFWSAEKLYGELLKEHTAFLK